jgi:hypothetical protein
VEFEKRHARLTAARASLGHLERRHAEGLVSSHAWEKVRHQLSERIELLSENVREMLRHAPELETEELDTAYREALRAQRSALLGLRHDGVISHDVFDELAAEIDATLGEDHLI